MKVMPANSSGWFWHSLARETGMLGHLFSPGAQRGPWPWLPYSCDNAAFQYWDEKTNVFDFERWDREGDAAFWKLVAWCACQNEMPGFIVVPDVPGNAAATLERWKLIAPRIRRELPGVALALAVQDGMTVEDVLALEIQPDVICVGGSTEWKWQTIPYWAAHFARVHVLRVNAPSKLDELRELGIESCDGTGWNMGDRKQTEGLELYCRKWGSPVNELLWPHVCRRAIKGSGQQSLLDGVSS